MSTSESGGGFYLPPFWIPVVTTCGIGYLQHQVSRMLAPLLKAFRTHERIGNGSIVDVHTALARALHFTESGYEHWCTIDFLPLADRLTPDDLAAPLWCGQVTKGFHQLVEFLIVMGDEYGLPRRGALHRTLVDLLLGERTDFVICRDSTSPSVVMRVGTEMAALCRTPSSLSSTIREIVHVMERGNPDDGCADLAVVADIGAGQSATWLGYRVGVGTSVGVEIADAAWAALDIVLRNGGGAVRATQLLTEWVTWMAPTFQHIDVDTCCIRIGSILDGHQLDAPPRDDIVHAWRSECRAWHSLRDSYVAKIQERRI